MSLIPAWRISHRPWHRTDNLSFESWASVNSLSVWSVTSDAFTALTTASDSPGFSGHSFPRCTIAGGTTPTKNRFLLYDFVPNSHASMFTAGSHSIRATARMFQLIQIASGDGASMLVTAGGSDTSSGFQRTLATGNFRTGWGRRFQNSWQLINTGSATWTGSAAISLEVFAVASKSGQPGVYVDDVRVFLDEFELPQHKGQAVSIDGRESRQRSLSGRVYNYQTAWKRTWKIPFDNLEQIGWERLDRWFAQDLKVWITDPSCNSYPAKFSGRKNPVVRVVPGNLDLRSGVIELEADYHLPIVGNVAGEPLP